MNNLKYNLIIIDRSEEIRQLLTRILKKNGYKVDSTSSVTIGINMVSNQCPDLVIIDPDLPDIDGKAVIENIRQWNECFIIVLSAKNSIESKISLLEAGADDYMLKPFSTDELIARIHTCLRRKRLEEHMQMYCKYGVTIDFERRIVLHDNNQIHFTPVEYRILEYLASNSGKVITYDDLLGKIWGPYHKGEDNRILRVNMANIRRKLQSVVGRCSLIQTEAGVGYRMAEPEMDYTYA